MQGSFAALSSFDQINLGSTFLQAVVALSFAGVQFGVARHFDRPAMRALARFWRLLAIAAVVNVMSAWAGGVWNNRELSRALNTFVVALLAAGVPYVQVATAALDATGEPPRNVVRRAVVYGVLAFIVHGAGVFGFGAFAPDARILAVTWSRVVKLLVLSAPAVIAWRSYVRAVHHRRALRLLAVGFSALALRQAIAVALGLRVGMPDVAFTSVIVAITVEVLAIMLFGSATLLANTAEELAIAERQAQALRIAEARIASGERMESLGRLAAGVAHDFNNVLHAVRLSAGLLRSTLATHEDVVVLDEIDSATQHGAALVGQLLTFARQQPHDPRRFDALARARALTPMLQRIVDTDATVSVSVADGTAEVVMDATQFEQIVINLVTNARDAIEGAGSIGVRLEVVSAGADADAIGVTPGKYLHLVVVDNGHGIDPDVRTRVFEPFFTTKPEGQGSGLGLAMVHGIASRVGGAVLLDSAPNVGTQVDVYLPVVACSVATVAAARPAVSAPRPSPVPAQPGA